MNAETPLCVEGCPSCADCCSCDAPPASEPRADRWRRFAWWLTWATVAWNVIEAVVAVTSGFVSGSIALVGFGLDSVVEVSSAFVIIWRLGYHDEDNEAQERSEQRAVRLIALSFFALSGYVTYDAVARLLGIANAPEYSPVGLAVVALSLLVMPALVWAKRRVASQMRSVAIEADANQTKVCAYLSGVVLLGLGANAVLGWWWMDPFAGLVVAAVALKEGREAWMSGDLCGEVEPGINACIRACCPICPAI